MLSLLLLSCLFMIILNTRKWLEVQYNGHYSKQVKKMCLHPIHIPGHIDSHETRAVVNPWVLVKVLDSFSYPIGRGFTWGLEKRDWSLKLHLEIRIMMNSSPSSVLPEGHTAFLVLPKDTEEWDTGLSTYWALLSTSYTLPNFWEERPSP